jgi:outer membrane protein, multidrug efflux system
MFTNQSANRRFSKHAAALLVSATLSACAVGPDYKQPVQPVAQHFVNSEVATFTEAPGEQYLLASFWTQFGDATLDQLVGQVLTANHDLRIAQARFAQARAIHRETRFDLLPTITAGGGYTEQLNARDVNPVREAEFYDGSVDARWELDLFGRNRRNVEASRAETQSAQASLRDVQVVITAEVTRTYFELRGQQQQLNVAQRNVLNQRETLGLVRARLAAGRDAELDTVRSEALLNSTTAAIAPLKAAVARSIHRLSVLTGQQPDALLDQLQLPQDLPAVPALVAVGDPASMLRRRPDIRVSERQLAAATARVGVAVADLFPHVSFTGSVGVAATAFDDLGAAGSGTRLIAPGISWAALDLGRVRAQIAVARAGTDAALARYEQTVLVALEETENALVTHARARERLGYLTESATASARAAELARIRYENGVADFLQVLDAERSLLQAEDQLAQSRTETATSLVAVYKALGGGWNDQIGSLAQASNLRKD